VYYVAWVQLEFTSMGADPFSVLIESLPDQSATTMIQAVVLSTTTSIPQACFGGDTLVLCSDGVRKPIGSLRSPVEVVATAPGGDGDRVLLVDVYVSDMLVNGGGSAVCQVGDGVWVTKDHTVSFDSAVVRKLRPASVKAPDVEIGGRFAGQSWIAGTLPGFLEQSTKVFHVYHLVPVKIQGCVDDTSSFIKSFAVYVGSEAVGCVAELYRSSAEDLMTVFKFRKVV
jgi:hypothetical protein